MNIGVIGFGNMAKSFVDYFINKKIIKVYAIASRSTKNINYKNVILYNNYEDLLNDKNIDAVYIATTNNTHYELIIEAAKHKKHILCEKPAIIDNNKIEEIKKTVKENNVILMECFYYKYLPQTYKIFEIIKSKTFGDVKFISTNFCCKCSLDNKESRIMSKELGGGVLYDLGCYCISLVNLIMNSTDKTLNIVQNNFNKTETNVDSTDIISLKYSDTFVNIIASFDFSLKSNILICGSKAKLLVLNPFYNRKYFLIPNMYIIVKGIYLPVFVKRENSFISLMKYFLNATKNINKYQEKLLEEINSNLNVITKVLKNL